MFQKDIHRHRTHYSYVMEKNGIKTWNMEKHLYEYGTNHAFLRR